MNRTAEQYESYRRTAVIVFVIILLVLSYLIVKPFLIAILTAAALAYIFYPLYLWALNRLPKMINSPRLASLLTCLVIVLCVLIPAIFIMTIIFVETKTGYLYLRSLVDGYQNGTPLPPSLAQWSGYLPQIKEIGTDMASQFILMVQGVLKGIPHVILSILITVFSIYYFLVHGKDLYKFFSGIVPLPEGRYKQILNRFDDLSRGMIMGQIVVGLIQGILAWLGFWYLNVPNPVLWGFLTAIISIIPLLGAVIVWLPIVVYLALLGMATGEYWRAVTLLLYGFFVISLIDNFLKPKIVGDHAKIHPLIILFGILGGIQLFGLPGILIGPLVLTIFDVVIEIYKEIL